MTCRRSNSELTVGMGSSSSPWTPNPGLFSPPLACLPTLPEPLQPLSGGACCMGAMCSAGYCSSENTAANSQIPAGLVILIQTGRCGSGLSHQPSGGNCQQSLFWNLPSTRKACLPQPCLTVPTHGPISQSTALWFARGEMRKPVIINLLSRKVPGLIPHLLLGTEMRHSYASQTLVTLI